MRTLVVLKPGWEKYSQLLYATTRGLTIVYFKEVVMPKNFWQEFYHSHTKAKYWDDMSRYLPSSSCVFIVLIGEGVIESARELVVKLRKKYQKSSKDTENIAHASTSTEDAEREIALLEKFFSLQISCKT